MCINFEFKGTWKYKPLVGLSRKREIDLTRLRQYRDRLPFESLYYGVIDVTDNISAISIGDKYRKCSIIAVLTHDEFVKFNDPEKTIVEVLLSVDSKYIFQSNKPVLLSHPDTVSIIHNLAVTKLHDISLDLITRLNQLMDDSLCRSTIRNKPSKGINSLSIQLSMLTKNF